jgi:hypothetical protein
MAEKETKLTPPYLPWATFDAFIARMKDGIPSQIDTSVMRGMSGATQSQLRIALRFLGLVDEQWKGTDQLQMLAGAHSTADWSSAVRDLVRRSYRAIEAGLDLKTATMAQLETRFREIGGVQGETVSKAIRFYLQALAEAEDEVSRFISAGVSKPSKRLAKRADNGGKRRPQRSQQKPGGAGAENTQEATRDGMKIHRFYVPTREAPVLVTAYEDITDAEWALVDTFMRSYIKLIAEKK